MGCGNLRGRFRSRRSSRKFGKLTKKRKGRRKGQGERTRVQRKDEEGRGSGREQRGREDEKAKEKEKEKERWTIGFELGLGFSTFRMSLALEFHFFGVSFRGISPSSDHRGWNEKAQASKKAEAISLLSNISNKISESSKSRN